MMVALNQLKIFERDIHCLQSFDTAIFSPSGTVFGIWVFWCGKFTYKGSDQNGPKSNYSAWISPMVDYACNKQNDNTVYFLNKCCEEKIYRNVTKCTQIDHPTHKGNEKNICPNLIHHRPVTYTRSKTNKKNRRVRDITF